MIHLLRKALNSHRLRLMKNPTEPHSPLHRAIFDTTEKRSQLFPDKRRIPGRKVKAIVVLWLLSQAWGSKKISDVRRMQNRRV